MASIANMEGDLDPRVTQVKAQYEKTLLKVLAEKEKAMDEQMKTLENYDEDDFEKLREKRKLQMQKAAIQREKNVRNGHGRYMELSDQKEFFDASKNSKQVVVHFFRGATWRCDIVNRHLGDLAASHLETRFVKIDAEKSPFLVERLNITILPSILCIKDGKTVHTIQGFDEFGGSDEFPSEVVAYVLSHHGVLKYDGPAPDEMDDGEGGGGGMRPGGAMSTDMRNRAGGSNAIREGGQERTGSDDELDEFLEGYEDPSNEADE